MPIRRHTPAHLLAAAVALAIIAPVRPAAADPGIYLTWNDCSLAPEATASLAGACDNANQEQLFLSFELPAAADSVIEMDAVVDVQTGPTTLPAWWRYDPEGCRYGMLVARAGFDGYTACADFWRGAATFDGPPVYVASSRGPNTARIVISFGVLASEFRALSAGTRYYAARLVFQNDPIGACLGCEASACLLFNSIHLGRLNSTPARDVYLETPGSPAANRVTWQSTSASCAAVPTLRHTWGQLKSLYR